MELNKKLKNEEVRVFFEGRKCSGKSHFLNKFKTMLDDEKIDYEHDNINKKTEHVIIIKNRY